MHDVMEAPDAEDKFDRLRISADRRELSRLEQFLEHFALAHNVDIEKAGGFFVAVHEIVTNAIVHGYRGEPGNIDISLWWDGTGLVARVRDAAPHFDPTLVPPPELPVSPDQTLPGGMGIHMVRQFVDAMSYRTTPDGQNEVLLVKYGLVHTAKAQA